jgi:hypothetical protein
VRKGGPRRFVRALEAVPLSRPNIRVEGRVGERCVQLRRRGEWTCAYISPAVGPMIHVTRHHPHLRDCCAQERASVVVSSPRRVFVFVFVFAAAGTVPRTLPRCHPPYRRLLRVGERDRGRHRAADGRHRPRHVVAQRGDVPAGGASGDHCVTRQGQGARRAAGPLSNRRAVSGACARAHHRCL